MSGLTLNDIIDAIEKGIIDILDRVDVTKEYIRQVKEVYITACNLTRITFLPVLSLSIIPPIERIPFSFYKKDRWNISPYEISVYGEITLAQGGVRGVMISTDPSSADLLGKLNPEIPFSTMIIPEGVQKPEDITVPPQQCFSLKKNKTRTIEWQKNYNELFRGNDVNSIANLCEVILGVLTSGAKEANNRLKRINIPLEEIIRKGEEIVNSPRSSTSSFY